MEREKLIQRLKINQLAQKMTKKTLEQERKILVTLEEAQKQLKALKVKMLEDDEEGDEFFKDLFSYLHEEDALANKNLENSIKHARENVKNSEQRKKSNRKSG
ncbi:hypothetical protein [Listeria valentina]|uniref:hypothetical protein n=1 Tax=Listeria valentina TaxID=2705293 RepID=UPI00142FC82E|nr:hypothetical protein [Listeria valentina]